MGVAGRDPMAAGSGTEDHRGVDHVVATCHAQELPRGTGSMVVQADDGAGARSEEPGEVGLAPPVSPHLADDAGGDAQPFAAFSGPGHKRDRPALTSLERDERSGVEGDPYRQPASPSIRSRSASVRPDFRR